MAGVFDPAVFDPTVFDTGDIAWAAVGTLALNGTASLTLTAQFAAVGTLTLNGTSGLTTSIQMAAVGILSLLGAGKLFTARKASTLSTCGHPMAADCDSWLLRIFQRKT